MWLLNVLPSNRKDKRYQAVFCLCDKKNACKGSNHKTVSFGQPGATTFIDGASEEKKAAYIARHKVRENWSDPTSAGALSRFLLWSRRSLGEAVKEFKKKFNL